MTPGTILFDRNFRFHDGNTGQKLFVTLTDGSSGLYICAKATSNGNRYGIVSGCQAMDRFPSFFIPKHGCCLRENTWIQLEAFYEFDKAALIQEVVNSAIDRIGVLDPTMSIELVTCATHSQDLTQFQEQELLRQIETMTT